MCTAFNVTGEPSYFGRTLDLECSLGEEAVALSGSFSFRFRYEGEAGEHYPIVGIAHFENGTPLFYDGMNGEGLCVAALNFPGNAFYRSFEKGKTNLASYELTPYLLCKCKNVGEARELLTRVNITADAYSEALPPTPLHWLVADGESALVVEAVKEGVMLYDNPFGVLTNNPPYPYHVLRACELSGLSPAPRVNSFCPKAPLKPFSRGMGAIGLPGDWSSSSRFLRAAFALAHIRPFDGAFSYVDFFHLADTVKLAKGVSLTDKAEPIFTIYTSCADRGTGKYYFKAYGDEVPRFLSVEDVKKERLLRIPLE